jgi:hypothetical protein
MNQQSLQRTGVNPLLSRFDADPGPWRPMYYPVTIAVPLAAGQSETGSVTINNQPFIFAFLGHQIIGNTGDPETSGLYQDGQYSIEFKDEQSNYQSAPVAASAAFGGGQFGFMIELPLPIPYPGAKTLTFRITNHYTRVLTPAPAEPVFNVKLVVGGMADWGQLA